MIRTHTNATVYQRALAGNQRLTDGPPPRRSRRKLFDVPRCRTIGCEKRNPQGPQGYCRKCAAALGIAA